MTPYRRILLIMTEAQANAALSRAMALSAASGASLHVLGIHESGVLRLPHELQEAPLHSASFMHFSTELKALLDEQSFVGARPGFEAVETSNPRDQLPACIARYAPDLVIKGCPGHSCSSRSLGPRSTRRCCMGVRRHCCSYRRMPQPSPEHSGRSGCRQPVATQRRPQPCPGRGRSATGDSMQGAVAPARLTTCPSPCWPTLTLPALG